MAATAQAVSAGAAPGSDQGVARQLTVARQMVAADLLKLRRKRGTMIWSLVLTTVPLLIYFGVRAVQHSSNAAQHGPAGGLAGFTDGVRILALFMGPLAAVLIGAEGGAGDSSAGVFRDLVVTGRSRLALFASRVPAAVVTCWAFVAVAFVVLLAGTWVFAGGGPTPGGSLVVNALLFSLLSTGVVCAVAVGFGALTNSRPATITALIGWQLVVSPLLAHITSLGSSRHILLSQAVIHYSPVNAGDRGDTVAVAGATALIVTLVWLAVSLGLGAWRTSTMDA